ncbi:hypothetical protein D3C75_1109790 [compost metagenome]
MHWKASRFQFTVKATRSVTGFTSKITPERYIKLSLRALLVRHTTSVVITKSRTLKWFIPCVPCLTNFVQIPRTGRMPV